MTDGEPPDSGHQQTPPFGSRGSWPILVVPTLVIVAAAVAGQVSNALATLAVGVAAVAVLAGLVAHHILGRRRRWIIVVIVLAAALPLLLLGLAQVDAPARPAPAAPAFVPPPPEQVNAGRRFDQAAVNAMREFRGADLRGAQLTNLDLKGFDFSGANAAGASFYGSRLDRAVFLGTNLGGAVLARACLRNAVLRGADLTGVTATEADTSGADVTTTQTATTHYWPPPGSPSPACT